jgi:hypothetical protein
MTHGDLDQQKAAAYLEQLQQEVYGSLGILPPHLQISDEERQQFEDDYIVKTFNQQRGHTTDPRNFFKYREDMHGFFRKMKESCPSRFQEPEWYSLLKRLNREIDVALTENNVQVPRLTTLYGSLPTGNLNGMFVAVPESDATLLLFDDGTFGFVNLISKAVGEVFPTISDSADLNGTRDEILEAFRVHPDVARHFADVLVAYLIKGNPQYTPPYFPGLGSAKTASTLRHSMEIFVLGRELGHLYCGHVSQEKKKPKVLGKSRIDLLPMTWEEEYEADFRGLYFLLVTQVQGEGNLSLSYAGLDLFFGAVEILEDARHILAPGNLTCERENAPGNPPIHARRERMREILKENLGGGDAAYPLKMAGTNTIILDTFWSYCKPRLIQLHNEGVRASPKWFF